MWRNLEVRAFVDWLREHNTHLRNERRVAFHGLDLYSMYSSIRAVLRYLDDVDDAEADSFGAAYLLDYLVSRSPRDEAARALVPRAISPTTWSVSPGCARAASRKTKKPSSS